MQNFCFSFRLAFHPLNKTAAAAIWSNKQNLYQHKPLFTGPASIKASILSNQSTSTAKKTCTKSKASTTPKASDFSARRMEWPVPKWPYQKPPGPWATPYSDQTGTIPIENRGGVGPMTSQRQTQTDRETSRERERERESMSQREKEREER